MITRKVMAGRQTTSRGQILLGLLTNLIYPEFVLYYILKKLLKGEKDMINGMGLITGLIIGALAGWIAGKFMDNDGSLLTNIILGLVGGFVGNLVLGFVGIHGSGLIGNLIVAVIGACIIIFAGRKLIK